MSEDYTPGETLDDDSDNHVQPDNNLEYVIESYNDGTNDLPLDHTDISAPDINSN